MKKLCLALMAVSGGLLVGCGSTSTADLDQWMAEVKARPAGVIKPIPPFITYKSFTYSAAGMRSPFDKPIQVKDIARMQLASSVKPNDNRAKEFLEQFGLDSLVMVGGITQGGVNWALIQDPEGKIHRVKKSNYMGRNHGRIMELGDGYLSLVEIVGNGSDGWVERPRTIKLRVTE